MYQTEVFIGVKDGRIEKNEPYVDSSSRLGEVSLIIAKI